VSGALVLMPELLRRFMINRSRAFIYATAPSPLMAAGVRAALKICAKADDRRTALQERIAQLNGHLQKIGLPVTGTQIQPIVLGADRRALDMAQALAREGFDIRAIRPPTVPEGTARLRITLSANLTRDNIDALGNTLSRLMQERAA
jgi:8-amino-7-oxononanoate synthase